MTGGSDKSSSATPYQAAARSVKAEVRLYNQLFMRPDPGAEGDVTKDLNPNSLEVLTDARLERIERAIEAVAFEVERIGEMERFAAKILAARGSELEPAVPVREPMPARTIQPPER